MKTTQQQSEVVRWLGSPEAYAHRPPSVQHLETHISHVFLAGSLVYKLKKPVKYDFLDFSTLAERQRACREELRLNRRLASEVYLRVVPITRGDAGQLNLAEPDDEAVPDASVVEWLVEMRRLPTELTLDSLYRRGELRSEHVARLAEVLIRFYRSLVPLPLTPEQYRHRYIEHVRANLHELLAQAHHLARDAIWRVHGFQLQLLQLCPDLLDARVRSGRIVDGHGDLRPEHICFSEPIVIFDCIEFNAEFRTIDVADELAFLAEECDCLGAGWVGPELIAAYQSATGDRPADILLDFYKAYRACVRAKVAALRSAQLGGQSRQASEAEAQRHLSLADQYAQRWLRPLALVVGGLSGTGKSTLARALADALGAQLLRTDVIRKEIFGGAGQGVEADSGMYQPAARKRVYAEMMERFGALQAERVSVVLDGTFSSEHALRAVQTAVADPRTILLAIQCVCRQEVARRRIGQRLADGVDPSDARPEIHDIQRTAWEAWPAEIRQVRVDTEQTLEAQVQQVMQELMAAIGGGTAG